RPYLGFSRPHATPQISAPPPEAFAPNPNLLPNPARAVPASMAPTALRVAAMAKAAVPTESQMRGPALQVVVTTIATSTETDMYLRNASMRGVIATYDINQTPLTRVAMVTTARRTIALIEATASTMQPHPHDPTRECPGNDVPARRQDVPAGNRDSGGRDQRKRIGTALPLADDNGGEVGDHDGVEAEARQIAQQ